MISNISFKYGNGLSAWNFAKKKVLHLNDIQYEYKLNQKQVHSFISMPLISHRKVVGIINFSHTKPNAFREIDISKLKEVLPVLSAILEGKILQYASR
jgi:putative methionine-R-sulfoxide reductase with GAF domain